MVSMNFGVFSSNAWTIFSTGIYMLGMSFIVVGQTLFDDAASTIERLIGGGVLVAVAILFVRWSLRLNSETRANLAQLQSILEAERDAWYNERAIMRVERESLRRELEEARMIYIRERDLRISLERAGVHDRRNSPETPEMGVPQTPEDG